ncbi:DUF937 domain-containing protein [Anderseniella sp. Alg231-50]|uniref:DUF937 domain-containing protein n=1 Tax=Anderseniella sp. Alg231-50 TaxID=1922226 RepID=UPI000D55D741
MNIVEMIARSHNGQGLDVLGQQFGLSREQTLAAVAELAPMVTSGVRRNTREPDGMVSLFEALSGGGHERYLDDDSAVQYDSVKNDGNAILGHLFGRKEVSREVAMQAAGTTGIGGAILKKMLPVIASMVMGAIFKRMTGGAPAPSPRGGSGGGQGGGLGDIIGDILGGGQKRQPRGGQGGGLGDILGDILGGGSGQQRSPAPQPQQRAPAPGGGLDDLLRDILGGGMGGGGRSRSTRQRPTYNDDAIGRGRTTLDDILGGDTRTGSGNAADDLLDSVNRRLGY